LVALAAIALFLIAFFTAGAGASSKPAKVGREVRLAAPRTVRLVALRSVGTIPPLPHRRVVHHHISTGSGGATSTPVNTGGGSVTPIAPPPPPPFVTPPPPPPVAPPPPALPTCLGTRCH
jgi:hypothetical protein